MPEKKTAGTPEKTPSRKRIMLFKGISIVLIPLMILCILEFVLRLFQYGNDLRLFKEYKGNADFLIFNPDASKRYFTDEDFATTGNREIFKKKKDKNTIRLFVLGESTTIGYPYFHNGSFHRWLQYRLMHTYPEKNFEVINLSLTAVNSYTVLGFAREVVDYEPDAILIYTGHNEFYGALGAASTQTIRGNAEMVKLIVAMRSLKIVQMIGKLIENTRKLFHPGNTRAGESRMQLMAASQQIPYGSELYKRGLSQFRTNMEGIFKLCAEKHIPLLVSTLVSNEKDLQPFVSFSPDPIQHPDFSGKLSSGISALAKKDVPLAAQNLGAANHEFTGNAACAFALGQVNYAQGKFEQARFYFSKASDLDGLRFRAPQEFNLVLTDLNHAYPGTWLVDAKTAFQSLSTRGIIGNNLILDHVHPNLKGYAVLSDAFYTALLQTRCLPTNPLVMSFQDLLRRMPISKADSLAGIYRILNLKRHWPYHVTAAADSIQIESEEQNMAYNLVFKKANWGETMNELYSYYMNRKAYADARKILESLSLEFNQDAELAERIAMLSGFMKDEKTALFFFKRAFELNPSFSRARFIFVLLLKMDEPLQARPYLDYAISNNTSGQNLSELKTYTEQIIALKKMHHADSSNISLLNEIASTYLKMSNRNGAEKYVREALKLQNGNRDSQHLLSELKSMAK